MDQEKIWDAYQNDPALQATGCRDGGRIGFFSKIVPGSARVLNIGVGLGNLERRLVEKGAEVYSLDPSERSIAELRGELGLGDRAKVGYSQDIPFPDAYFDYVVMSEVLEHLSDDVLSTTVAEVNRVLRPGGRFTGSVPADEDLSGDIVVCPDCGKRFHRWGHQQSFSERSLGRTIAAAFSDVEVKRVVFAEWKTLNWKGKVAAALRSLQAGLGRRGGNQNLYFSARKT